MLRGAEGEYPQPGVIVNTAAVRRPGAAGPTSHGRERPSDYCAHVQVARSRSTFCVRSPKMECPTCAQTLVMATREGIEIDYCPTCRGVWLDRGELDKIIERSAVAFAATGREGVGA